MLRDYIFALGIGPMPRGYIPYTIGMALDGYIYTIGIVLILDMYMGQIEVLARAGVDRLRVGNSDVNGAGINGIGVGNVTTSRGLVGEFGIPKSELISQLI